MAGEVKPSEGAENAISDFVGGEGCTNSIRSCCRLESIRAAARQVDLADAPLRQFESGVLSNSSCSGA
jgi:hypothetical protein